LQNDRAVHHPHALVLVAQEDLAARHQVGRALLDAGFTVATCGDAARTLELARRAHARAAIVDPWLPGASGPAALIGALREAAPHLVLVSCCAGLLPHELRSMHPNGVHAHVPRALIAAGETHDPTSDLLIPTLARLLARQARHLPYPGAAPARVTRQ
jgi:hypothetical protein